MSCLVPTFLIFLIRALAEYVAFLNQNNLVFSAFLGIIWTYSVLCQKPIRITTKEKTRGTKVINKLTSVIYTSESSLQWLVNQFLLNLIFYTHIFRSRPPRNLGWAMEWEMTFFRGGYKYGEGIRNLILVYPTLILHRFIGTFFGEIHTVNPEILVHPRIHRIHF